MQKTAWPPRGNPVPGTVTETLTNSHGLDTGKLPSIRGSAAADEEDSTTNEAGTHVGEEEQHLLSTANSEVVVALPTVPGERIDCEAERNDDKGNRVWDVGCSSVGEEAPAGSQLLNVVPTMSSGSGSVAASASLATEVKPSSPEGSSAPRDPEPEAEAVESSSTFAATKLQPLNRSDPDHHSSPLSQQQEQNPPAPFSSSSTKLRKLLLLPSAALNLGSPRNNQQQQQQEGSPKPSGSRGVTFSPLRRTPSTDMKPESAKRAAQRDGVPAPAVPFSAAAAGDTWSAKVAPPAVKKTWTSKVGCREAIRLPLITCRCVQNRTLFSMPIPLLLPP